jgi:prophage regulatory protein
MKLREVVHATGLSRSTLLRLERAGSFPRKVKLSARRVGWVEAEVGDWLRARLADDGPGPERARTIATLECLL